MELISGNAYDLHRNAARTSNRPKRTPITRNEDFFMGSVHIKNSVVDVNVRSGNCVRCIQNCVYKQNDICDKNIEVQKFKIVIDKEDKHKNMRQRNIAKKHNVNNTTEGYNSHDLTLTHILPHKHY